MLESRTLYWPSTTFIGPGAIKDMGQALQSRDFKKALVVTDQVLNEIGIVDKITAVLAENSIDYVVFDQVQPNPTTKNVNDGLAVLKENDCDFILSLGGGSPQDAAKGIGILATNGGNIKDYEGIDQSDNKSLPIVAVNTTAGTASEVTINYVITNEDTHIKMVMVDKNSLAEIAVSDPKLMTAKPADLTAATGMDVLTHAVEAYVSEGAFRLSDKLALESIELVGEALRDAVENGDDLEARSKMAYASYIAGMSFNNAGLGYVHCMAHQLGGMYDLPHGVCNAVLLPHVEEYNSKNTGDKLRNVAQALGKDVEGLSTVEANQAAIEAIKELSSDIGIPAGLEELGVKEEDLEEMAKNALNDVCKGTNPREVDLEATIEIYKRAM
ncbi:alcohol dehydrogenase [Halanaerobium saccharolyticum]|uniref:Alcohol dehydrogenase n=1 Tax=Halanaerobium saccharolyticum TaxID=43595 RepID=A0A4R7YWX7_9FIRM|nr:iron-containing alcohol dehydrogenase [Halanaerobium saccharolyticum]RAK06340.1 alcohol dehydrogenase [Halanaerobium saccharolyticum]TDW00652.1 alcohol dehydrogenase [Halanaerobium saccharolyticum]TDX52265.1 alcohol dehydrogenase [Halanaerobium saccharolyticum]